MNQTWENCKKPSFGSDFCTFSPNLDCQYFFWVHIEENLKKLKYLSFLVKDDELLEKYSEIRNRLKSELESEPVYNEKYLKAKIKSYDGKINKH